MKLQISKRSEHCKNGSKIELRYAALARTAIEKAIRAQRAHMGFVGEWARQVKRYIGSGENIE